MKASQKFHNNFFLKNPFQIKDEIPSHVNNVETLTSSYQFFFKDLNGWFPVSCVVIFQPLAPQLLHTDLLCVSVLERIPLLRVVEQMNDF